MSSETSTDVQSFRPWHLFVLIGLAAATIGVVVVRPSDPVALVLLIAAIGSAAGVGYALHRALSPLLAPEFHEETELVGGRARGAIEREKTLTLRAIKELEFDRAMGKVSDEDFEDVSARLRQRAIALMRQLEDVRPGYRDVIEQELAARLARALGEAASSPAPGGAGVACSACGTANEDDARFCKACGARVGGSE